MIYTRTLREVTYNDYDEVWAIVRSLTHPNPRLNQVTALAPSKSLFFTYLDLRNSGNWNEETFETLYKPRFLKEMQSEEALEELRYLKEACDRGLDICLTCFCTDLNLCHRKLVAALLREMGVAVDMK